MATTHISEAEAASDFLALMNRVRAGDEVIIESDSTPIAVVRPATSKSAYPDRPLLISESLARAKARAERLGYESIPDDEFAADMEQIISKRRPADHSAWD